MAYKLRRFLLIYGKAYLQIVRINYCDEVKCVNAKNMPSFWIRWIEPRSRRLQLIVDSNIGNSWLERNFCLFLFHISIFLSFDIIRTDSEILIQMCKTTLIASAASLFNCIIESILHTLAKCIYAKSNLERDHNGRLSSELRNPKAIQAIQSSW